MCCKVVADIVSNGRKLSILTDESKSQTTHTGGPMSCQLFRNTKFAEFYLRTSKLSVCLTKSDYLDLLFIYHVLLFIFGSYLLYLKKTIEKMLL